MHPSYRYPPVLDVLCCACVVRLLCYLSRELRCASGPSLSPPLSCAGGWAAIRRRIDVTHPAVCVRRHLILAWVRCRCVFVLGVLHEEEWRRLASGLHLLGRWCPLSPTGRQCGVGGIPLGCLGALLPRVLHSISFSSLMDTVHFKDRCVDLPTSQW